MTVDFLVQGLSQATDISSSDEGSQTGRHQTPYRSHRGKHTDWQGIFFVSIEVLHRDPYDIRSYAIGEMHYHQDLTVAGRKCDMSS